MVSGPLITDRLLLSGNFAAIGVRHSRIVDRSWLEGLGRPALFLSSNTG